LDRPARKGAVRPVAVIVDVERPVPRRAIRRLFTSARLASRPYITCPTEAAARELREIGAPASVCHVVPDLFDPSAPPSGPATLRKRLGVGERAFVLAALPGAPGDDGAFQAVWAALLAAHVHADLRVTLHAATPNLAQIRRVAAQVDRRGVIRIAPPDVTVAQWLTACDAAALLSRRPGAGFAPRQAAWLGKPLLLNEAAAADDPPLRAAAAAICRDRDPADAAGRLLALIERRGGDEQARAPAPCAAWPAPQPDEGRSFARLRAVYAQALRGSAAERPAPRR